MVFALAMPTGETKYAATISPAIASDRRNKQTLACPRMERLPDGRNIMITNGT